MTIAAYRDRTSGEYPITVDQIRARVNVAFGAEPTQEVLDEANVDPVEALEKPPYDPATHTIAEGQPEQVDGVWRQTWTVTALPPPPPIRLTIGFFVGRLTVPEYDDLDDAMQAEARLIRRLWNNDRHEMTEGDDLWTIIARHLDAIVSSARKAELLSRPDANASMAAPADEAMAA